MKINRKDTPKRVVFGEVSPATTFTIEGRIAVFMKVDMSNLNIYCSRCDEENYLENNYAINLETGEIEEFSYYRTSITPINCELNEI